MRYVLSSKIYSVERKRFRTVNPEAIPAKEPPAPDLLGGIGELDSPRNLRLLRAAFWAIAILAGFLQTWAARFWLSPDATNYLDIASTYLRADWKHAVNGYWSPFFSWLLALAMGILHPVPYWESTLLHLVNFAGMLIALGCFEYFLRGLLLVRRKFRGATGEQEALPELTLWVLGYGIFLSTSLFVLNVATTTPDVWVFAFTSVVAGLILRIHIVGGGWRLFALLGFTLALAYFSKTFYFPMSFVFLFAAWMAAGNLRHTARQAVLGLIVFLAVAGPWIAALSMSKGRFTFGDVGKLAFTEAIDRVRRPALWLGENGSGTPRHPVRLIHSKPEVFEYATPIGGTYPPGYDWSYWLEGMTPRFQWRGLFSLLRQSAGTYYQLFVSQAEYATGLFVLLFLGYEKSRCAVCLAKLKYLWIGPLIACCAYALVLVEGRYVAPFLLLLWLSVFYCLIEAAPGLPQRAQLALVLGMVAFTGLRVTKGIESDIVVILSKPRNVAWEVSQGLRVLGVRPGERASVIGGTAGAYWARLAGVRIVAEIPLGDEDIFWESSPEAKQRVFRILAGTGAKMVVTKFAPPSAVNEGWISLGNSSFFAYPLAATQP